MENVVLTQSQVKIAEGKVMVSIKRNVWHISKQGGSNKRRFKYSYIKLPCSKTNHPRKASLRRTGYSGKFSICRTKPFSVNSKFELSRN